jgi:hypothetical protein
MADDFVCSFVSHQIKCRWVELYAAGQTVRHCKAECCFRRLRRRHAWRGRRSTREVVLGRVISLSIRSQRPAQRSSSRPLWILGLGCVNAN